MQDKVSPTTPPFRLAACLPLASAARLLIVPNRDMAHTDVFRSSSGATGPISRRRESNLKLRLVLGMSFQCSLSGGEGRHVAAA